MEEYIQDRIKDAFYNMSTRKRLNIVRNGYALLKAIEEVEDDEIYARDLDFTNRTASEIGLTLSAFEELYGEELRHEYHVDGELGKSYCWNIGLLRDREENKALKELLNW